MTAGPGPGAGLPDDEHPDVHGLLVVRAWSQGPGDGVRARVWSTPDVGSTPPVVRVVGSRDDVLVVVREWLAGLGNTGGTV
ncbi:hypothetical protein [Kineosporia sp. A_224]|uniref:hypothetical protein n=1 Tax=Kineosporia sp. A_224 TaxID=1962180 RepID=UPI000B4B461C|nr:hypothetical protein [Kineosporia sp. A_224]